MNAQGKSNHLSIVPMEIVDPPEPFTPEMLRRFPDARKRKEELTEWWVLYQRPLMEAMKEAIEALQKKVNSTS